MSTVEAVFLDRDGVINEEVEYASDPKDLCLIPGSADAIRRLNGKKIPVIVVTNQAGVARGYFSEAHVEAFHKALSEELKREKAYIDKFYYCPHHPTAGKGKYKIVCDCRKPMPGLLHQAAREMSLNLKNCVMVGDKASDIGAGSAVGARTVLVMTGYGRNVWSSWKESCKPSHVAEDLSEAVAWILNGGISS